MPRLRQTKLDDGNFLHALPGVQTPSGRHYQDWRILFGNKPCQLRDSHSYVRCVSHSSFARQLLGDQSWSQSPESRLTVEERRCLHHLPSNCLRSTFSQLRPVTGLTRDYAHSQASNVPPSIQFLHQLFEWKIVFCANSKTFRLLSAIHFTTFEKAFSRVRLITPELSYLTIKTINRETI